VTRPRQILPDQFYLLTRRATQRQFLFRPDDEINNAFAYCMGVAAERCNITILITTVESNHHHTVIYDPDGRCPEFIEHFHKLIARCINARYDRRENVWASVEPCVTLLVDYEAVLSELTYAAANPVKDRLVERAVQWPGLNGYRQLLNGKPLRATRPKFFFKRDSALPKEILLTFSIPKRLGDREEILEELKARVEIVERDTKLARKGAPVVGVRSVCKMDWRHTPGDTARKDELRRPKSEIRPRFAGRRAARNEAIEAFLAFLESYRVARSRWLAGLSCVFPAGTYWMRRFTPIVRAPLN
jgi:hypothetical protein